jgi:hypothetical protein
MRDVRFNSAVIGDLILGLVLLTVGFGAGLSAGFDTGVMAGQDAQRSELAECRAAVEEVNTELYRCAQGAEARRTRCLGVNEAAAGKFAGQGDGR